MSFHLIIEITSHDIEEKRGTSKQGTPYVIREQLGYVDLGQTYPVGIRVPLDKTAPPYTPGRYMVDNDSLYVDRYGKLSLGRLRLKPATPSEAGVT